MNGPGLPFLLRVMCWSVVVGGCASSPPLPPELFATAGPDRDVVIGRVVELSAAGSRAAEGLPLSYAWTLQVPAGSAAALTRADGLTTSLRPDLAGVFRVGLTITATRAGATFTGRATVVLNARAEVAPPPVVAVPTALTTTPGSPSREASLTLSGRAAPGLAVRVHALDACAEPAIASTTADAAGRFSLTVTAAPNATTVFTARAQDSAGNVSACSAALRYEHDTVPPAAPVLARLTPVSPSPDRLPVLEGTAEGRGHLRVFGLEGCEGPVLTQRSLSAADFRLEVPIARNVVSFVTARFTDAAGNDSPCSSALRYHHDDAPPPTPWALATTPPSPASTRALTLRGRAEVGSNVALFAAAECAGSRIGEATAGAAGDFAFTLTAEPDTTTTYSARATDAASQSSGCSAAVRFVHDGTLPAAPTLTRSEPASPTRITPRPFLHGRAEPLTRIEVFVSADCAPPVVGRTTADAQGDFRASIDTPVLNSTAAFRATALDAAGNRSACSAPLAFTHDDRAPEPPRVSSVSPASPGPSRAVVLTGAAEDGVTVEVFDHAACTLALGATAAAPAGFTLSVTVAARVRTRFFGRARDAAGNVSACVDLNRAYEHDDVPPPAPTIASAPPPPRDGATSLAGRAEPGAQLTVHASAACSDAPMGSGQANASGAFDVALTVTGTASVVPLFVSVADAAGNRACYSTGISVTLDSEGPPPPVLDGSTPASPSRATLRPTLRGRAFEAGVSVRIFTGSCSGAEVGSAIADADGAFSVVVTADALGNGTTVYFARSADALGNASSCSAQGLAFTHDNVAPAATATAVSPASPNKSATPTVTGTAEPDARVTLYANDGCVTPLGTATANAQGQFGISATLVTPNVTHAFNLVAVDTAGNASACLQTGLEYTHDTRAPVFPPFDSATPDSPSPIRTFILTGDSGEEEDTTLRLYATPDCSGTALADATVEFGGFEMLVTIPTNATVAIYGAATDAAGNTSVCQGTGFTLQHDETPPTAPTLSLVSPSSPSSQTTVTLMGRTSERSALGLYSDAACLNELSAVETDDAGNFSVELTVSENQETAFFLRALDLAGNDSGCVETGEVYIHDDRPPTVPAITEVSPSSPSQTHALTISGEAEPGSFVAIYADECGGSELGSEYADANGQVTIHAQAVLNTTVTLYLDATDEALNTSDCGGGDWEFTHDSESPAAPSLDGTTPESPSTQVREPLLYGTAEANATVRIHYGERCSLVLHEVTADDSGYFEVTTNDFGNMTTTFSADASDAAGNASGCSNALTYTHDDLPPPAPTLGETSPRSPSSESYLTLSGQIAESGVSEDDMVNYVVYLYSDASCGDPLTETSPESNGAFELAFDVPTDTETTFYVKVADALGNESECHATNLTFTHDGTAPEVPSIDDVQPVSPSRSVTNPTVSGSAEALSTVKIYGDSCGGEPLATTTATSDGSFEATVAVQPNSETYLYVSSTDATGNESECSSDEVVYVHDDTQPSAAEITIDGDEESNSSNDVPLSVSGDEQVRFRVWLNPDCAGDPAYEVDSEGGFESFSLSVPANQVTTFAATALDRAGNESACVSGPSFRHDDTPPEVPTLSSVSPTSPSRSETRPTLTGQAEAGADVNVYAGGCGEELLETTTARSDGGFTVSVSVSSDSETFLYLSATDALGNESDCTQDDVVYVHDGTAPTPPFLTLYEDSPSNTTTLPYLEAFAEEPLLVEGYASSDCSGPVIYSNNGYDSGDIDMQLEAAPNAVTHFSAIGIDLAGNRSECSNSVSFVHDSVALLPTLLGTDPASPNSETNPTLFGVTEPHATIDVYLEASCGDYLAQATADSDGVFSMPFDVDPDTTTTLYTITTDALGNVSACAPGVQYRNGSGSLEPPLWWGTSPSSPSAETSVQLLGSTERNAVVSVYSAPGCLGAPVVTHPVPASGGFLIPVTVTAGTTTTFFARAQHAGGAASPCTPVGLTFTHSMPAPHVQDTSPTTPGSSLSPRVIGRAPAGVLVRVYGQSACGGPVLASGQSNVVGSFAVPTAVSDGSTTTLSVRYENSTGVVSPCSANSVTYRHIPGGCTETCGNRNCGTICGGALSCGACSFPSTCGGSGALGVCGRGTLTIAPASPANHNNPTLSGPAAGAASIRLHAQANCAGAEVASATPTNDRFSVSVAVADNSATSFSAALVDGNGQVIGCSNAATYVEDSQGPAAPSALTTNPTSPGDRVSFRVRGFAEAGATVSLYRSAACGGSPLVTGSAEEFATPGFLASVSAGETAVFSATARDSVGNLSGCSSPLTYVHRLSGTCSEPCGNRVCGLNACGQSCGTCGSTQTCTAAGACRGSCVSGVSCTWCGEIPDGCGGTLLCGACPRWLPGVAYDPASQQIIMQGGFWYGSTSPGSHVNADSYCIDAWAWNGSAWRSIPSPGQRGWQAASWHEGLGRVLMFGGSISNANQWAGSSVTWDGASGSWADFTAPNQPAGRASATMVFDPRSGKTVMFGGYRGHAGSVVYPPETLLFDGQDWASVTPVPSPSPRYKHAMAYDEASGRTMIFGGQVPGGSSPVDTWEFDSVAQTWTNVSPPSSPPFRHGAGMAYHAGTRKVVLFGGVVPGAYQSDTWLWDGLAKTWTRANTGIAPEGRTEFAMAYHPPTDLVILFGGNVGGGRGTWAWDGAKWGKVAP